MKFFTAETALQGHGEQNQVDGNLQLSALVGKRRVQRIVNEVDIEDQKPIPILVMAAKRPLAIRNHLEQLLKYRPSPKRFPIIVSQDGVNEATTSAIEHFVNASNNVFFMHHKDRIGPGTQSQKNAKSYFYIAQHYKWALDKVFSGPVYEHVVVTEDDLDIAQDFFSYFLGTRKLLKTDSTIWCISAWNDNGGSEITDRAGVEQLYRTDFFPGLGWMLTKELWQELSPFWPEAYWDDWLRKQEVRKNRVCIRPEVSRTAHNNKVAGKGSSGGLYNKYFASIHLPEQPVDFLQLDLSYLVKDNYDRILKQRLAGAKAISVNDIEKKAVKKGNVYRVIYKTPREYRRLAKAVGLMNDIRSGMPRTAYYGVVPFLFGGSRIYAVHPNLSPDNDFMRLNSSEVYDEVWDKMTRFLDFEQLYCTAKKYTGKCDPKSKDLIAWFEKKKLLKRLTAWGEMIVN
ncbi:unnamed protein product [Enterobius vermicularis]|uniref:Alpha-1,3-mannosyl-glycoprotein 2-beta-N-acetylglucosaminyltransferase n=1 Tax=Enterobius vermicularis TaxID=51028 RepID=A0A0N4VLI5_ENTVE|nr:unnamed protein product [Enterobius vermicularis]